MSTARELYQAHLEKAAFGSPLSNAMARVPFGQASLLDLIEYIRWELWEAIYSLPPEAPESRPVDGDHASACAARCTAALSQLQRRLLSGETVK